MKSIKIYLLIICLLSTISASFAQVQNSEKTQQTVAHSNSTLNNQFNYLKDKSNTYQEYKVIKISYLNNLWKNVQDSLNVVKDQLIAANKEIKAQSEELKKLKEEVSKRDQSLANGEYEKAHINVLGIDMLKANYIYLSWSIIGALVILLTLGYFRYKSSKNIAFNKSKDLESLSHELNDFKQKSREKELKMGRELQTERNRVEELNQKIISLKKQVHL